MRPRALVFVLFVAGCSSHAASSNGDGAAANPTTADGFCQSYFDLVAQYFSRCDGIPLDYTRMLFASDSPCKRLAGNIAAGRLGFDGTNAGSCLQAVRAALAACGAGPSMDDYSVCAPVLTPLVPLGGTCTSFYLTGLSEQCKDGAFCKEGPSYACTGVCTARLPVGSPCDSNTDVRCV